LAIHWQQSAATASWLEPPRYDRYKGRSMIGLPGRDWWGVLLAYAIFAAPWPNASTVRAEQLFTGPEIERDDQEVSSPWSPPEDFAADADDTEELPIELESELSAEEDAAAKPKRAGSGGMGGPFGRGGGPPIGYRAFGEPTVDVDNQPTTFEHWGQELSAAFPAWTSDPHLVLISASVSNDLYDTAAVFPTSGLEFPESLWNIRLGANYIRTLRNDWKLMGGINIGSASDVPFGALRDVNPAVFSFLSIPWSGEDAWNLGVFYSPLAEIPFPIPTVAYHWHASDELEMNIGLPAQITWRPTEQFTFTGSYMLLHTITARGNWQIDENWCAYVAYENRNRAWFMHDRERDDERLFSYDQAVLTGIKRTFLEKFAAELTAGYMFGRFYFIGEDYDDRNQDRIDVDAGLTVSAQVGLAW
jgi:hypothetical protein